MIKITYKEYIITSAIVDFLHKYRNSFKNFDDQNDMQKRVFTRLLIKESKRIFNSYAKSLDFNDVKCVFDNIDISNKIDDEICECDFTMMQSAELNNDEYYRFEMKINIHDYFVQVTKYIKNNFCCFNQIIYF